MPRPATARDGGARLRSPSHRGSVPNGGTVTAPAGRPPYRRGVHHRVVDEVVVLAAVRFGRDRRVDELANPVAQLRSDARAAVAVRGDEHAAVLHDRRLDAAWQSAPGGADVEVVTSDGGGRRHRTQPSGQRLERDRLLRRRERPPVVDGEVDLGVRSADVPRQVGDRGLVDREAAPREHAAAEGGHDGGDVRRRRLQMARADQPTAGQLGRPVERGGGIGDVAVELHVGPGERFVEVGQLVDGRCQHGQAIGRPLADPRHGDLHDHQRQPRHQPVADGRRRREQPGQLGTGELDHREQVRLALEVTVDRVGAHDLPGGEAGDVTWTAQAERHGRRLVDLLHRQLHVDRGRVLARHTVGVDSAVGDRSEAPLRPRGERDLERSHDVTSCVGTTSEPTACLRVAA